MSAHGMDGTLGETTTVSCSTSYESFCSTGQQGTDIE